MGSPHHDSDSSAMDSPENPLREGHAEGVEGVLDPARPGQGLNPGTVESVPLAQHEGFAPASVPGQPPAPRSQSPISGPLNPVPVPGASGNGVSVPQPPIHLP